MIQSEFIKNILDLTFDNYEFSDLLRKQIPFLSELDRNYTGSGVFVNFVSDKEIEGYKIDTDKVTNFDTDGNAIEILNGVEIRNDSLDILADASVYLTNGLIDSVEIWNKNGQDYLLTDPEHYELHQIWIDIPKRRTIVK